MSFSNPPPSNMKYKVNYDNITGPIGNLNDIVLQDNVIPDKCLNRREYNKSKHFKTVHKYSAVKPVVEKRVKKNKYKFKFCSQGQVEGVLTNIGKMCHERSYKQDFEIAFAIPLLVCVVCFNFIVGNYLSIYLGVSFPMAVLIAPITEELIKRVHLGFAIVIYFAELYNPWRLFAGLLHIYSTLLPLHYAILYHFIWNTVAVVIAVSKYYKKEYEFLQICDSSYFGYVNTEVLEILGISIAFIVMVIASCDLYLKYKLYIIKVKAAQERELLQEQRKFLPQVTTLCKTDYNSVDERMNTRNTLFKSQVAFFTREKPMLLSIDSATSVVIDIGALMTSIYHTDSLAGVTSAVIAFLRSSGATSAIVQFGINMVDEIFRPSKGFKSQSFGDVLTSLRYLLDNWDEAGTSPLARKFTKFVGFLLVSSLIPKDSNLKWSICGFQVFASKYKAKNVSFGEFAYSLCDLLLFFVERGYQVFLTGDPKHMLLGSKEGEEFEVEYATVAALAQYAINADLDLLDDKNYCYRLRALIEKTTMMIHLSEDDVSKVILGRKLTSLKGFMNAYILKMKKESNVLVPFSLLLYGNSKVGKTTVATVLAAGICKALGVAFGPETIWQPNLTDQYHSGFKTGMNTALLDDLNNQRLDSPVGTKNDVMEFVRALINNTPVEVIKADLESKGLMVFKFDLVLGTTNTKYLDANIRSNEPASILRRFKRFITVKVKPEYADEAGALLDGIESVDNQVTDVWLFDVEEFIFVGDGTGPVGPRNFRKVRENITLEELTLYVQQVAVAFKREQIGLRDGKAHMFDAKSYCSHNMLKYLCTQDHEDEVLNINFDPQAADVAEEANVRPLERFNVKDAWKYNLAFKTLNFFYFKSGLSKLMSYADPYSVADFYLSKWAMQTIVFILCILNLLLPWILVRILTCVAIWCIVDHYAKKCHRYVIDLHERPGYITYLSEQLREIHYPRPTGIQTLFLALGGVAFMMLLASFKSAFKNQSSEVKKPEKLVNEKVNVWNSYSYPRRPVDRSGDLLSRTATLDQLINNISKNMFGVIIDCNNGPCKYVNALAIQSNLYVFPNHAIPLDCDDIYLRFISGPTRVVGRDFDSNISSEYIFRFPKRDLMIVVIPRSASMKDLKHLLLDKPVSTGTISTLIGYHPVGKEMSKDKTYGSTFMNNVNISTIDLTLNTNVYDLKTDSTADGMCGMIYFSTHKYIDGFHIAGDKNLAVCSPLYKTDVEKARKHFDDKNIFMNANQGNMNFGNLVDIPLTHPANFTEGRVDVIGHDPLNANSTFKSQVKKHIMADTVESVMDLHSNKSKPYKMNSNWHFQRNMSTKVKDKPNLKARILRKAQQSIQESIDAVLSNKINLDMIHPYDMDTVLGGSPGIYGVNSLNYNTGAGHGFDGKKSKYVDRELQPDGTYIYTLDPELSRTIDEMEESLKKGERPYFVKTSKIKDEPAKFIEYEGADMSKLRVYEADCMAGVILSRKYLLGVARVMMNNPLIFECAVGLDATGIDWQDICHHLSLKFPGDFSRTIDGDYETFDAGMRAEVTSIACALILDMCRKAGYSEEQLTIVRGILTEICFPIVKVKGSFFQYFGVNPSGHMFTVFINNLVNMLYIRYAYYTLYPNATASDFVRFIRLLCYGDDNIMTVSDELEHFNHTTIQQVLAEVGIIYTRADKGKGSLPFNPNPTFLKRSLVWDVKLGRFMAPIEEASISKMLIWSKKSDDMSDIELAVEAITNAAREYAQYDEDVFTLRLSQLKEVAFTHGLDKICDFKTYEVYNQWSA